MGTPDSSRIWDGAAYAAGKVVENSKEGFRKMLQGHFPDPDVRLLGSRLGTFAFPPLLLLLLLLLHSRHSCSRYPVRSLTVRSLGASRSC